ncbi:hypothetical protein GZH79_17710 [Loktanella sp. SALINAS62]|nr:hypothetical protein [Loktanella sp. SALINAS62]
MVQQSPSAGAHREYPASRSRGKLLCSSGKIRHGRVTKSNQPPANPARFSPVPRDPDYTAVIQSSRPVMVQHTHLDSRSKRFALMTADAPVAVS